jgi:glycosyltransferase involved in cell wall biosynthesis
MNICVLTLTRDRLAYTQHCFATLRENAGCEFDHFVFDQASTDGTKEWLLADPAIKWVILSPENVGICAALNQLLERALQIPYDVIVRFDNDCEVTQPGTLRAVCETALAGSAIIAPRVLGLRQPPSSIGSFQVGDRVVDETAILGGIFMAVPAHLFTAGGFRYGETNPLWAGDERICDWYRGRGGRCGYLDGFDVNHYETTDGQLERYPDYFARKREEGCPV